MFGCYFSFNMLTTNHSFSLNLMTKSAQTEKCKSKWKFSASSQQLSIKAELFSIRLPYLITYYTLKLLASVEMPNHCCVHPNFLHNQKYSVPLNNSLYLLLTSWRFRCVEMFNCSEKSWKGRHISEPFPLLTYILTPWSRVLLEKLTSKLCS